MLRVKITVSGPRACGKTHLADRLRGAIEVFERETGQSIDAKVTEKSTYRYNRITGGL